MRETITCPTCNGHGTVTRETDEARSRHAALPPVGGTCHCDGPPHPWSPGWCP